MTEVRIQAVTDKSLALVIELTNIVAIQDAWDQKPNSEFHPSIAKTWDDAAMATLEVPLADPIGSP